MAKREVHEEHENHERWLVSYADFITLLFAFFVVMYAVSRVDTKRLQQVTESIKWAMHVQGTGGVGAMPIFDGPPGEGGCAANIGDGKQAELSPEKIAQLDNVRRKIQRRLRSHLINRDKAGMNAVVVVREGKRLSIRLASSHFFDPSSAALRPESLPVLDAIAAELKPLNRPVRIEGHTDATPVKTTAFRNNWALSAARAATVVAYIASAKLIDADMMSAVGLADTRPLVKGTSPDAREQNRRVEMVIELGNVDALIDAAH